MAEEGQSMHSPVLPGTRSLDNLPSQQNYNPAYTDTEDNQRQQTLLALSRGQSDSGDITNTSIDISHSEPTLSDYDYTVSTTESSTWQREQPDKHEYVIDRQPTSDVIIIENKDEHDEGEKIRMGYDWLFCFALSPIFFLPLGVVCAILTALTWKAINRGDHKQAKIYYGTSKIASSIAILIGLLIPVIVGVSRYHTT